MAAQIILLIIIAVGLGINLNNANNPGEAWGQLIGTSILVSLLYWGGFWDVFFI